MLSTDTSISQGRRRHAGNGQSSNYNNNVIAALTTPVMDMSDALPNPTQNQRRVVFLHRFNSFVNDKLTIFGRNAFGAWSEVGSITGTIDNVFTDGANWQTFSVANKGHSSPLIPVPDDLFHSRSQFKFEFTSDATGTDIGFYIDDVVIVYEQKVRPDEFSVSAQGVSTNGAMQETGETYHSTSSTPATSRRPLFRGWTGCLPAGMRITQGLQERVLTPTAGSFPDQENPHRSTS